MTTFLVAVGGVAGALARYGITRATLHTDALIWATAGINIAGSFALGLIVAGGWLSRDVSDAVGVGFLGGFTTFSTFTVQIVLEADGGRTGTAAAYLYSLVATLAPGVFPADFIQDGRIGVYFEAAAVIISLTLLGQILELKARSQTSAAIR